MPAVAPICRMKTGVVARGMAPERDKWGASVLRASPADGAVWKAEGVRSNAQMRSDDNAAWWVLNVLCFVI